MPDRKQVEQRGLTSSGVPFESGKLGWKSLLDPDGSGWKRQEHQGDHHLQDVVGVLQVDFGAE